MDSPRKMLSGDVSHSPGSHDSSPGRPGTAPRGHIYLIPPSGGINSFAGSVIIMQNENTHDSANESAYFIS